MNLVSGEWIPVIWENGETTLVGLQNIFQEAHRIHDFAVRPPQRIALMRLLICIAQAALDGPENEEEWRTCKVRIPQTSVEYLQKHSHLFELYGEKPFMQVPTLKHTYNSSLDKLDFGLAAGGGCALYDHQSGRAHDDAWIALMLITYQLFCPGGTIGVTKWGDQSTQPGKNKGPGSSAEAIGVEQSALHTFIRGNDLLETVHKNLLTKQDIVQMPNASWGKPTWEHDLSKAANEQVQKSITTYLGRLLPLTRAIRLTQGSATFTLANGLTYPKLPEYRETTATVVQRNDRLTYVSTSLERHPWRDMNALLAFGRKEGGVLALSNLRREDGRKTVDIWTGGMSIKPAQYKIFDTADWSFSVPLSLVGNDGPLAEYRQGVEYAENASKQLYGAVLEYAKVSVDGNKNSANASKLAREYAKSVLAVAQPFFWSNLDQNYQILVETVLNSTVSFDENWMPLLYKTMHRALEKACPHRTPRQIMAFAKARKIISLKKLERRKNGQT